MMKMQEPLSGQAVGNMLYGMQSMSSDVQVCVLPFRLPALLGSCWECAQAVKYAVRYAGHEQ
jgi:hypothetical protein